MNKKDLVSISQAAKELGVCNRTLKSWVKRGVLRAYRIGLQRDHHFDVEDIEKLKASWLDE